MKKKVLMLTAFVAIAGSGVLFALNNNSSNEASCSGSCCTKSECCTEGACSDCTCGTECSGENCDCGCTCCE